MKKKITTMTVVVSLALGGAAVFAALNGNVVNEPSAKEDKTVLVAIDDRSIQTLGPMPISRSVYTRVAQRAKLAGAKVMVLKFFFDRETQEDKALAAAMDNLPVAVQISVAGQGVPNVIALSALDRFARPEWKVDRVMDPLTQNNFLGPNPTLLSHSHALGMVDARIATEHDRIESFGRYQGLTIPSLQIVTAEMALGMRSVMTDKTLVFGAKQFELDPQGRLSCPYLTTGKPHIVSIDDFLDGKLPDTTFKNKVIVIGYVRGDAPHVHVSNARDISVHEYFYRQVLCLLKAS